MTPTIAALTKVRTLAATLIQAAREAEPHVYSRGEAADMLRTIGVDVDGYLRDLDKAVQADAEQEARDVAEDAQDRRDSRIRTRQDEMREMRA